MTAGSRPRIGVLALQGDVREHQAALEEVGAQPVQVRRPAELEQLDGLVLPGGESTTISTLLQLFSLLEPLRDLVGTGLPAFGSCAGLIMLADRVVDADFPRIGGLDITVRRNAFGRQVESFESAVDIAGVGPEVPGVFIRAPWVESVGPNVRVLATVSVAADTRIVAVRQGALLASAFHPEITGDRRLHRYFVDIVRGQA